MLNKKQIIEVKKNIIESQAAGDGRLPIMFNALGDPGRFRIFRLLMARCDICVTDLANIFGISVPAASQQLRVLEMTGLVKKERLGQTICYEVRNDDPLVKTILKLFSGKPLGNKASDVKDRESISFDREKVLI